MPGTITVPPTPPAQGTGGTSSFTGLDLIRQALHEIGALAQGETPRAEEAATGLEKLNRLLDAWNADGRKVYTETFQQYTLVPNLQPHTIGPGGPSSTAATFFQNQRPVKLVAVNIILNQGNPANFIRYPLNVRDGEWWQQKRAFAVQGTLPTDVYYEANWPNGSLFIWPVPLTAYLFEAWFWTLLNQVQLSGTQLSFPPGYCDAIIYSLAVSLCPSYARPVDPTLAALAMKAIQRIEGPNMAAPRMGTRDWGQGNQNQKRASFNYLTGQTR